MTLNASYQIFDGYCQLLLRWILKLKFLLSALPFQTSKAPRGDGGESRTETVLPFLPLKSFWGFFHLKRHFCRLYVCVQDLLQDMCFHNRCSRHLAGPERTFSQSSEMHVLPASPTESALRKGRGPPAWHFLISRSFCEK